jgi:hypothetical protein
VVDRIKRATHNAEPMPFMRLSAPLPGEACRARWRRDHYPNYIALTVRAALADRPGDQQQDGEYAERDDPEAPGRNRQFTGHFGLKKR